MPRKVLMLKRLFKLQREVARYLGDKSACSFGTIDRCRYGTIDSILFNFLEGKRKETNALSGCCSIRCRSFQICPLCSFHIVKQTKADERQDMLVPVLKQRKLPAVNHASCEFSLSLLFFLLKLAVNWAHSSVPRNKQVPEVSCLHERKFRLCHI